MKNKSSKFAFLDYCILIITLAVAITFGIIIYTMLNEFFDKNIFVFLFMIIYIIFTSSLFSFLNIFHRKYRIEKPVEQILEATERIAQGDFDIKLIPLHSYSKFDEYDMIKENINKMASELSKSEILKNDFISNVSHEIKTPLTIIKNYSKALLTNTLDNLTKREYLTTLINISEKLSNLISNILKLNKLENQSLKLTKNSTDISALLQESIINFEETLDKKNIELACEISDVNLFTDSSFIEIIFNNIISNAVKFTPIKGKIYISLKESNEYINFSVKDTGCGMSESVGKHVFEKFYQGDTSHTTEGNGLGLPLVKKIIDILGGEISIQSKESCGTTFTVKLKKE